MTRITFAARRASLALLSTLLFSMAVSAQNWVILGGHGKFGTAVVVLTNGNFVVTDPEFDEGGVSNIGAVYLYNGLSLALIATLKGTTAEDKVGSGGVTALTNGNYVVRSPLWDGPGAADAGAATWGNGTSGISGTVSITNSVVGATASDQVSSSGVTALTNGNYVVRSPSWDGTGVADAGAATWGNGASGLLGTVSAANSLVGASPSDAVGTGVTALSNGNYVVISAGWDNPGVAANAGAITWCNGAGSTIGTVSTVNSLVGSSANDMVGSTGVTALTNGSYVVCSPNWDRPGVAANVGAATWGSGTSGVSGAVSAANSLIGSSADDNVGYGVTALSNGNYVVSSSTWNNGGASFAGAATWGSGTSGVSGAVSAANSLVGSSSDDYVGEGVTALTNGNYVVYTLQWNNGAVVDAGAATWGNGATGISGAISASNSLVGQSAEDYVGTSATALSNGNYVVTSFGWHNGSIPYAGAATWVNGTTGVSDPVSTANSLVGTYANDQVGFGGVTALTNGNYVVRSESWTNGGSVYTGAATWCTGTGITSSTVSAANSFIGSAAGDRVSSNGVLALSNGNYVVNSPYWFRPGVGAQTGAVTWGNGATGSSGPLSDVNSLVGYSSSDKVGNGGLAALANGNYVVKSPSWYINGFLYGAISLGRGACATPGRVHECNSATGVATGGGAFLTYDYNNVYDYILVGEPLADRIIIHYPSGQPLASLPGWITTTSVTLAGLAPTPLVDYVQCLTVGSLYPSGASPVSGQVTATHWYENAPITYAGTTYTAGHYEITPAANAATATGVVTLYYSQSEFDSYNSASTIDLPTGPGDAAGIANIRIRKFGGSGDSGGLPASYSGGVSTINPVDASIVWNAIFLRWEVTFDVTGFSGFFLFAENIALPVSLTHFSGKREGTANKLSWTTVSESNNRGFTIERSLDGTGYASIGFIASKVASGNSGSMLNYTFTDHTTAAKAYYRLVQTDFDGRTKTSAVVLLRNSGVNALAINSLYPNPTTSSLTLSLESKAGGIVRFTITDMAGRVLRNEIRSVSSGVNGMEIKVSALPSGTYSIRVTSEEGEMVSTTFVKQ
jgi:hypothetical protein